MRACRVESVVFVVVEQGEGAVFLFVVVDVVVVIVVIVFGADIVV